MKTTSPHTVDTNKYRDTPMGEGVTSGRSGLVVVSMSVVVGLVVGQVRLSLHKE